MTKVNLKFAIMLLGVIALNTLFISCSDDEKNEINVTISKENIIGKWDSTKIIDGVYDDYEAPCPKKQEYIEFFANGIFLEMHYDKNCKEKPDKEEKWILKDNQLIIESTDKYDNTILSFRVFKFEKLTEQEMLVTLIKEIEDGKIVPQKGEKFQVYSKRLK